MQIFHALAHIIYMYVISQDSEMLMHHENEQLYLKSLAVSKQGQREEFFPEGNNSFPLIAGHCGIE